MLRDLLVVGAFLFSLFSFSQDTVNQTDVHGRKQGFWRKHDKEGFRIYEGQFKEGIPFGKFTYYYQNSKIRTISIFSTDGIVTYTTSWFPNGHMMAKGKYINQQRDSLWQFFSEYDGALVSEEFYKMGIKEGLEKIFYPGKAEAEIITWKEGIREGPWKQFYDDGAPKLVGSYHNNEREGPIKTFLVTGKVLVTGQYKNSHQDGTWTYYDDRGNVTLKEYYDEGILLKKEEFEEKE